MSICCFCIDNSIGLRWLPMTLVMSFWPFATTLSITFFLFLTTIRVILPFLLQFWLLNWGCRLLSLWWGHTIFDSWVANISVILHMTKRLQNKIKTEITYRWGLYLASIARHNIATAALVMMTVYSRNALPFDSTLTLTWASILHLNILYFD